jgi:hypothetical protein
MANSFGSEHHADKAARPGEITTTQQQLSHCLDSVGSNAQQEMVAALRKYHDDPKVLSASKSLHEMWAENCRKLLDVLR